LAVVDIPLAFWRTQSGRRTHVELITGPKSVARKPSLIALVTQRERQDASLNPFTAVPLRCDERGGDVAKDDFRSHFCAR
jgi:hypothetical protein